MVKQVLLSHLRAASTHDVETALAASKSSADIEFVDAVDLLEFFNRMLDLLVM
jgi:hypothetical protein